MLLMKQRLINAIKYFGFMFSIAGVIIGISVYYYWKIFGWDELLKNMLGSIIGAGLIVPLVTLFMQWKINK